MAVVRSGVVTRVILYYAACLFLLIVMATLGKSLPELESILVIGGVGSLGTWLLSWIFVRWEGLSLASVGAQLNAGSPIRFGLGFALGLLLVATHALALYEFGHTTLEKSPSSQPLQWAFALLAYGFLASREELAFHGYPLHLLSSWAGAWPAMLVVTTVFAVEHVAGGATWFSAIAGAGAGSLMFGAASLATRGLAVPIGLHAAWNFGDWLRSSGGKISGGLWHPVVETGFEPRANAAGWISYLVLMLVTAAAFAWFGRIGRQSTQPIRP